MQYGGLFNIPTTERVPRKVERLKLKDLVLEDAK